MRVYRPYWPYRPDALVGWAHLRRPVALAARFAQPASCQPASCQPASGQPVPTGHPVPVDQINGTAPDPEAGAGTALALGLIGVIAVLGIFLASLTAAAQQRWQAQLAADFGAIAGASALRHGLDYCEIARATVALSHATQTACELQEFGQVVVTVEMPLSQLFGFRHITTTARAGPRY